MLRMLYLNAVRVSDGFAQRRTGIRPPVVRPVSLLDAVAKLLLLAGKLFHGLQVIVEEPQGKNIQRVDRTVAIVAKNLEVLGYRAVALAGVVDVVTPHEERPAIRLLD